MDLVLNIVNGFSVALSFQNLLYAFIGCVLGTAIGVLPGIGPIATISMLLPATFALPPTAGLIMLAGIYYGSQYGGSTTAILVNMPGESSSVVTCVDGYQMARNGRAGAALMIAAIGSFFAGTVATLIVAALAIPLADVATKFGPPEFFSTMVLGLLATIVLATGSFTKAVGMILAGLLIGCIGTDINSGVSRYTFGWFQLSEGVNFVPLAVGIFGITEILSNLEAHRAGQPTIQKMTQLWMTKQEWRLAIPAVFRGTAIGSVLGMIPGGGILLSTFASYTVEKKFARDPSRFGHGAIEGVAGPESANNAASQISFIPMLMLGIPPTVSLAMMVWAMMFHGIQPGPFVITRNPDLFWGLIASMWIGNLMLLILNLPMIGLWVKLLSIPYRLLFPAILLFCAIGIYSLNTSPFEIMLAVLFGAFGYLLRKLHCEPAPFLLGFVIGPMMEENLRRSMLMSRGSTSIFIERPISATMLVLAAGLLVLMLLPFFRRNRETAFQGEA